MQGTGDEFPKREETVGNCCAFRVVVMGGGIVHIGREPNGIGDLSLFHESEQIGHFKLAAKGCSWIGIRDSFEKVFAFHRIADADGQRHIAAEDFPSGSARAERMFQPSQLFGTEDCRLGIEFRLLVRGVWASVGSQIQDEQVQERAPG